jgi:hypothetical protein
MIVQMASAIAEGQSKLDKSAIATAKFLATTKIDLPPLKAGDIGKDEKETFPLIALGFNPPFYQFTESIIEVKMAITMATSSEFSLGVSAEAGWGPFSASVNASYSNKYDYKVEGSSLLRTTLKPVPPPAGLQAYIEALIKLQIAQVQNKIAAAQPKPA